MRFSGLDRFLWAASFLFGVALLAVIVSRGRWRAFPILTAFLAFGAARTIALFFIYSHGSAHWYARLYFFCLWLDFALQLAVAIEIAGIVLRPTGTWLRDARTQFVAAGFAGAAVAAVIAWYVSPPAHSAGLIWWIRGNLFTSLVICELFVAMSMTANRLGLGWRSHVMAVGQGLTVWSSVMVITTALQSYWGRYRFYSSLDDIRVFAYLGALFWIALQLWKPEPERQPIDPELRDYILALHSRVEYDLRRLDARH